MLLFWAIIGPTIGSLNDTDFVLWEIRNTGSFSVNSYNFFAGFYNSFGPCDRHDGALSLVWKLEAPFKIKAFDWRIMINRLLTKDLLKVRGIPFPNTSFNCAFCDSSLETMEHIFFKCPIVRLIWRDIT